MINSTSGALPFVDTPRALPRFIYDLLTSVPRHGEGVHQWLFRVARVLHPYREEQEIADLLRASVTGCGRPVSEDEIFDAVRNSASCAWESGVTSPSSKHTRAAWPAVNQEQRRAITSNDVGLPDLWEASPVRFDDDAEHSERIVDAIFPGNPLLCVGESATCFRTCSREELRGELASLAFIVPSPMTAREGRRKHDSALSAHTLDNTGPRRFLVIEFDTGSGDEHAAILLHLAAHAPLTLAVHSGGKSLHGWFCCDGQEESALRTFMRSAVSIGADSALWTRSQFARMPDGTRNNGQRQAVYFFNPATLGGGR